MNRSVWFPGDLAERVEAAAKSQDRSFNYIVVRALESALVGAEDSRHISPGRSQAASSRAPLNGEFRTLPDGDVERFVVGRGWVPLEEPSKPEDIPGVQKGASKYPGFNQAKRLG